MSNHNNNLLDEVLDFPIDAPETETDREEETEKQSPKTSTVINTEDLLNRELGLEEDAYRSGGIDMETRPTGADLGVRVPGQFYESPNAVFQHRLQSTHQEMPSQEELQLPTKFSFEVAMEDVPSQMMEESYDGEELCLLEPDEFNKSTAVISTQEAEVVRGKVQSALAIMQSSGREVVYENEGYAFDVNFTHENKSCELEILLLETPDEHPTPGAIAILYNKLNGNGFTFQRFYRESVATTAKEGLVLRALNGGHLPTMQVMTDEFQSSNSSKHVDESMKLTLEAIVKIIRKGSFAEPLREVTATLLSMAAQYPEQVLEFCVKEPRLVMNLQKLMRTHFSEAVVSKNIFRFFSAIIKQQYNMFNVYQVCKQIQTTRLFAFAVKGSLYWALQKNEKLQTAKLICADAAKFIAGMTECFFSQGEKASAPVKMLIKKVVSSIKAGGEFGEFRMTMSSLLPRLN